MTAKIGLALGGGAARGLAHIGVVQALSELGIKVSYVAGTSSGSIVGAFLAAGFSLAEMIALAKSTTWHHLAHVVIPRRSLVGNDKMERFLAQHLGNKTFDELCLPFAAVATDLRAGEKLVIQSGPVARAIRASCTIPGIFPPVEWEGRLLVDGGLVENVPVQTVREMGATRVIAVDLYAAISPNFFIDNIFATVLRSYEITQRQQVLQDFQTADVCLAPSLEGESLIDLHKADFLISVGYDTAMQQRDKLLQLAGT